MSKFEVGDKVVPVSKSWCGPLAKSLEWKKALKFSQPYLFVTGEHGEAYICQHREKAETGDFFLESDLIPYEEVVARIEPKEKPPVWYTLPAPVEEKIEPDYKGFYEFVMEDKNWGLGCNVCVVKDTVFCTKDTSCFTATRAYAENKFIKRG